MLKLNEKFQIREDDELNYGLYELKIVMNKKTKEQRMDWAHIGYYGKVSHALSAALNKYIKECIGEQDYDCRRLYERIQTLEKELLTVDVIHPSKIRPVKGVNQKEKKPNVAKEPEDEMAED